MGIDMARRASQDVDVILMAWPEEELIHAVDKSSKDFYVIFLC